MTWNISYTIHMNPSCIQEIKFIELMRAPVDVTSKKEMQKSAKIRNTLTSFTHILMQIMQWISLIDTQSPQQFISSMSQSLNCAPRKILKHQEEFETDIQEQCTQECYIKTGSEASLDQLVVPWDLHKKFIRTTNQQLKYYWQT